MGDDGEMQDTSADAVFQRKLEELLASRADMKARRAALDAAIVKNVHAELVLRSGASLLSIDLPPSEQLAAAFTVKGFIMDAARAAFPQPVRARTLTAEINARSPLPIHPKTVGMSLYRHMKAGRLRRVGGRDWYYVTDEPADV